MKHLSKIWFLAAVLLQLSCATIQKGAVYLGEVTENETLVKAAADMTPQQEYYLGRGIAAQILSSKKLSEKKNVQAYVNFIGQYLSFHSDRPDLFNGYRFAVIDEKLPMAMSAPGGYVFVSSGLMALATNEDEIAAVLAHEVAHISQRHAEKNIRVANQLELGKDLLKNIAKNPDNTDLKKFSDYIAGGVDTIYNQDQEIEADREAIRILKKAGYSPAALKSILQRIPEHSEMFGKHPRTKDRVSEITQLAGDSKITETDRRKDRFANNSR